MQVIKGKLPVDQRLIFLKSRLEKLNNIKPKNKRVMQAIQANIEEMELIEEELKNGQGQSV